MRAKEGHECHLCPAVDMVRYECDECGMAVCGSCRTPKWAGNSRRWVCVSVCSDCVLAPDTYRQKRPAGSATQMPMLVHVRARPQSTAVEMAAYATWTGTRRNLYALKRNGWRLLVTPDVLLFGCPVPPLWEDLSEAPYAVDNGAWGAYNRGAEWDGDAFEALVRRCVDPDWVVVPDIVAGGLESLGRSREWIPRLRAMGVARMVVPVQDGMTVDDVRPLLAEDVGIFVGGSTKWKLATMNQWGDLGSEAGVFVHVGRVNTIRRIEMCSVAGVHSFDGTSCTRFAVNCEKLQWTRHKNRTTRGGHSWLRG